MFGTIRKHQTWLWAFLVTVMSVSLVALFTSDVFVGKSMGSGRSRGSIDRGSINGKPITDEEYRDAWNEVRLTYYMHSGKWPGNDENESRTIERETISRVFLLHKLKEMNIKVSEKAVAMMVQEQLHDYNYAAFEKDILL